MNGTHTEQGWLDSVRLLVSRGDTASARSALARALDEFPRSAELLRAQAGVLQQAGQTGTAEGILRELLGRNPGDAASAFPLARMYASQGRTAAAAEVLRACFASTPNVRDVALAINAIELLVDIDRLADAAAIAEAAITATPGDPRLHAYAGMLAIQLGDFERARARYGYALQHDPKALEWHVAIGLANTLRYRDASHPDLDLLRDGLKRDSLSNLARAELHFALGKVNDDLGDYPQAARHFREGNSIRHGETQWSAKAWRRMVAARLSARRGATSAQAPAGFTPVFVVGMPRTGTTLLAELLSRHPRVRNRGELPTLARLAAQPDLCASPDRPALQRAAEVYATRSRQDDAADARWFIDKQPLNFRYVDLALAMFPAAKVIHCRRNPRDTALSLWMQCFLEDVQGYSFAFDDIATVMRDEQRLMAHWQARYPDAIRDVRYEGLVANPASTITALAAWLGLPPREATSEAHRSASTISTASLWQARQPVNTRSVDRWRRYATLVPELRQIPET